MIFVTGDTHGKHDIHKFAADQFPRGRELTKNDVVVILGDFGLIWDYTGESKDEKNWLDWLNDKPWTTCFVDGNHENYDRLNDFDVYPVEEWCGGHVQKIRPSVIHLMRGEIYDIQGNKCFCMGGASSHDVTDGILEIDDPRLKTWMRDPTRTFRINHVGWWKEELPSDKEYGNAKRNLAAAGNSVDFIFTHCAPTTVQHNLGFSGSDRLTTFFDDVRINTTYRRWFCGHYHLEEHIYADKLTVIYNEIEQIA